MDGMEEPRQRPPGRLLFEPSRRRQRSSGPPIAVLVVLVLVVGAAGYGLFRLRGPGGVTFMPTPAEAAALAAAPGTELAGGIVWGPLPALGGSDAFVRDLLLRLSAHPRWAGWLLSDELIRRFVRSVADVARGSSPAAHVEFMAPEEPFEVQSTASGLVVAPASFRRYDAVTAVFASLDAEQAAELYRGLEPLFEEAFTELGLPGESFHAVLAQAIGNLLAVQVPETAIGVSPHEGGYRFAEPRLESLTPAEKHVMRMGPSNARQVQAKLAEVAGLTGLLDR